MATTHVAFEGGSRAGTTATYQDLDDDSDLYFDTPFEPQEMYKRTAEIRTIDGVEHVVFRLGEFDR